MCWFQESRILYIYYNIYNPAFLRPALLSADAYADMHTGDEFYTV